MADFAPRAHVPLAPLTTFEVGGPAQALATVQGSEELVRAFDWAAGRLPVVILGGGSNVVVADRGLDALVLRLADRELSVVGDEDDVALLRGGAGLSWDTLVAEAVLRDLAGVECLSGIPGGVGATPIQNVGAYGQEVAETIREVEVFFPGEAGGRLERWTPERCAFSYRDSAFKRLARGSFVVVAVTFALRRGGAPALRYAELARSFAAGHSPGLAEVRARVIELRRAKSMVLDPRDENRRSAGSFFTNPIVAAEEVELVAERARRRGALAAGEVVPTFAAGPGRVKLPAGWLIERAGFPRGTQRGAVGLSSRHALAIVAHDGARAADVIALAREIQGGVLERLGVRLTPEPELLGFTEAELGELRAPAGT